MSFHKVITKGVLLTALFLSPFTMQGQVFKGIQQLVERRLPALKDRIEFEALDSNQKGDVFTIQTRKKKLHIQASSPSAASSAVYYYLREFCHMSISHCGNNLGKITSLPDVQKRITIQSPFQYRYALNYCTYNYTYTFYDWDDWQWEIDWMALNGVNLMLAPIGLECVWAETLSSVGFTSQEIDAFIPGPAYTAWWLMGNLEGWGGPMPTTMREYRKQLQIKILARMKELGIEPVIQGFNGMVPNLLAEKFPQSPIIKQGLWGAFQRPAVLLPGNELFEKMSDAYYTSLRRNYGSNFKFLGGDLFHEGGNTKGINLKHTAKLIQEDMQRHIPQSIWLLQGWNNNPKKELLDGLNKQQTLVVNLAGEITSTWEQTNQFYGTPWIWGSVNHFGGKTDMGGQLPDITREPYRALAAPNTLLKGIGILPEGINANPIVYDIALKTAWSNAENLDSLLRDYIYYRYGQWDSHAYKAWKLMSQSVYGNFKIKGEGTFESILCARPGMNVKNVSTWGPRQMQYEPEMLVQALIELRQANLSNETYQYDLIDLTRQVIANYARVPYNKAMNAFKAKDRTTFKAAEKEFMALINLQDKVVGHDSHFLLGKWLDKARHYAAATSSNMQLCEGNARKLITYWGPDNPATSVHDYANKEWSGLLTDYYKPRWQKFFENLNKQLDGHTPAPIDYFAMEKAWCEETKTYPTTPYPGNYLNVVDSAMQFIIPLYKNPQATTDQRVEDLLGRMTLKEKVAQMRHIHFKHYNSDGNVDIDKLIKSTDSLSFGCVEAFPYSSEQYLSAMYKIQKHMRYHTRLGIPVIPVMEGLHGVVQDGCTIFPQSIALGATFNPQLVRQVGHFVGKEMQAIGAKQALAPDLDIARELRWGRVEETYGEDPLLISKLGAAYINGLQDYKQIPTLKHFVAHGTPAGGLNLASVRGGRRELLGLYAKPFEYVIRKCNPLSVMNCYSSYDGEPITSSPYFLKSLLRDSLHFKGYVYSDWGSIPMLKYFHYVATNDAEAAQKAIAAGLDLEASSDYYQYVPELIKQGKLNEKDIDDAVRHILYAKFASGLFDDELPDTTALKSNVHTPKAIEVALNTARESIVLLENRDNCLPLSASKLSSIAVIGPNADHVQFGDYSWSDQKKDGVTPLEGIRKLVGSRVQVNYAKGCDLWSQDKKGFDEAIQTVQKSDLTIVCVGTQSALLARASDPATSGEGFDLSNLTLPGVQQELVDNIAKQGKPFIVVLVTGRPLVTSSFNKRCNALLVQWYGGEQSGTALAEVLFGKVNPSGHLPISFPKSVGHLPCYYNYLPTDKGFYNKKGTPENPGRDYVFSDPYAEYSFGFGRSYTHFAYSKMMVQRRNLSEKDTLTVSFTITNQGTRAGMAVPQLYIRDIVGSVTTPVKQLYAFEKLTIAPKETKQVRFTIPVTELALYNAEYKKMVEPGDFSLMIGSSSDQILLTDTVTVGQNGSVAVASVSPQKAINKSDIGKPISISGVVRDVQATPMRLVKVSTTNSKASVTTDKKGIYRLQARVGDTLIFEKKGYQKVSLTVTPNAIYDIEMMSAVQ